MTIRTIRKESIQIETMTWNNPGKKWFHKHQWVSIRHHPRGGAARACFMMDDDECDGFEMCLTCKGRRFKK